MAVNQAPDIHNLIICGNIFIRKDGKYLLMKRSPLKKLAPGVVHPFGGKIDLNEDSYEGARREVFEETGLCVKNMKLEAIILEILPPPKDIAHNQLIFHFSADYESGELNVNEEGEPIWLIAEEIFTQKLFPSVRETIRHILNPKDGTVFASFEYDDTGEIMQETKKINVCAL